MLDVAKRGLADLADADAEKHLPGLMAVATFGLAATHTLQNLRGIDREGFDKWYAPERATLKADPIARYFYKLRSQILKEGDAGEIATQVEVKGPITISNESIHEDMAAIVPPPPGATGFVFGDEHGGNGWIVELLDETRQIYYVPLPEDYPIKTTLHFADPPAPPKDANLDDTSIQSLARYYIHLLVGLVRRAKARWG
jgi:hypothetical protein